MKYKITLQGKTYEIEVKRGEAMVLDEYEALAPVTSAPVAPTPVSVPVAAAAAPVAAGTPVTSPLPGNVLKINVSQGQAVRAGDVVVIIEAMKMENEITAPCDGTVKQIVAAKGAVVNTGDILLVI